MSLYIYRIIVGVGDIISCAPFASDGVLLTMFKQSVCVHCRAHSFLNSYAHCSNIFYFSSLFNLNTFLLIFLGVGYGDYA